MRYLPQTAQDRASMLQSIGVEHVDGLYEDVPAECLQENVYDLPLHKGELEVERELSALAGLNHPANDGPFFLGAGCYNHHIPATVDHIIQRSEYLTAYTPYQPEISQGTLSVVFEFQTMIARLTGQDVANASMYDGATSMAEAALMAMRVKRRKHIHLHGKINPQYTAVLHTYMRNYPETEIKQDVAVDENAACVIVQLPDFYGNIETLEELRKQCDESGALLVVVVTEIVSLGLVPAPIEADIVVGEAQSVGVAMSFGGPHLGFFACKQAYLRQMPGRLCGITEDVDGKRAFVLTLNTREQHIRREKATSNICTNQGLCATAFTIHMSLLGEKGFLRLAQLNHEAAIETAEALAAIAGVDVLNESFFNEFAVKLPYNAAEFVQKCADDGIIAGLAVDENILLVAATEMTRAQDIEALVAAVKAGI